MPEREHVIGGFVTQRRGREESMPVGPTVWVTYKDTADIYLNPPVKPTSFDTPESILKPCQTAAGANPVAARRTLVQTTKVSDVLQNFR
jgi:hypothetical protein